MGPESLFFLLLLLLVLIWFTDVDDEGMLRVESPLTLACQYGGETGGPFSSVGRAGASAGWDDAEPLDCSMHVQAIVVRGVVFFCGNR